MMILTKVIMMMMMMMMTTMMILGMKKVPLGQVDQVYSQDEPALQLPHSGFSERLGTQAPGNDVVIMII